VGKHRDEHAAVALQQQEQQHPSKEAYIYSKRGLHIQQKRPTYMVKEEVLERGREKEAYRHTSSDANRTYVIYTAKEA